MTWNYRIIKRKSCGESYLGIHEVYYDKDKKITSWTKNPVLIQEENISEMKETILKIQECIKKDILEEVLINGDFILIPVK